jgi:hypothetical protein
MKEERLYGLVGKFLQKELKCFIMGIKVGSKYVGFADVVGVRDVGGAHSEDIQVMAVEVKPTRYNFAKSLGQALGYSLFANKSYLAVPLLAKEKFTLEEKEMATRLGVGLIAIKRSRCREILTPPNHQPIDSLMVKMLEWMDYSRCSICGTLAPVKGWTEDLKRAADQEKTFYYGKEITDRPLLFTKRHYRWIIVCSDCVKEFGLAKIKKKNA